MTSKLTSVMDVQWLDFLRQYLFSVKSTFTIFFSGKHRLLFLSITYTFYLSFSFLFSFPNPNLKHFFRNLFFQIFYLLVLYHRIRYQEEEDAEIIATNPPVILNDTPPETPAPETPTNQDTPKTPTIQDTPPAPVQPIGLAPMPVKPKSVRYFACHVHMDSFDFSHVVSQKIMQ